jgi:hypothetical protein
MEMVTLLHPQPRPLLCHQHSQNVGFYNPPHQIPTLRRSTENLSNQTTQNPQHIKKGKEKEGEEKKILISKMEMEDNYFYKPRCRVELKKIRTVFYLITFHSKI